MKSLNNILLNSFDIFLLRCLVCLNLVKSSYLKKFNRLLRKMSSKEENIFLLKGNALFNNELIQFKSLELNDQNFAGDNQQFRTINEQDLKYSTTTNYSSSNYLGKEDLFEQLNLSELETKASIDVFKNLNSILNHQNQLIEDKTTLQLNEKDTCFDEETVDYRVEHIRKLAGLFMMNNGVIQTSKSTVQKEIDYGSSCKLKNADNELFDLKAKQYSTELIDLNKSEKSSKDKLFDLNESLSIRSDKSLIDKSLDKSINEKEETKKYIDENELKEFEHNLIEKYKKIRNDEKTKLYDSTGEDLNNSNSSPPSSLNSIKSSDLSTILADYNQAFNYLNDNQESLDFLKLEKNESAKHDIEQKLNESRSENLNLMIALENNNTTMKKNLEMAKSLKFELESTKSNFDQFKQQTNLVVENLMGKSRSLSQELMRCKQQQLSLEEAKKKELDELELKHNIELNDVKSKLKDKDEQLKLTTNDLYLSNKKIKEQAQKQKIIESKHDDYEKKFAIYIKELNNQKNKLDLNKEEIEVRKRRILTLEETLGDKLTELDSAREEFLSMKKSNKQLEEKNDKLLEAVKQVDAYADKFKIEYEKRMSKEKDVSDLKQAIKRVITERDESFKQLELLKSNWKQYQQQQAEQQLQLQQQLTTTSNLENKYLDNKYLDNKYGRLSKIYSSPSLNDYYDTSKTSIVQSRQTKHRLNQEQAESLALEKIEDDKNSLMNVLSKQNYLNNLLSLSEQLNCDQCMLSNNYNVSNSYSQFNTLKMNSANSKQHLADHSTDLMNLIRQQKEMNELAFLKNGKKLKKESQKIAKLEKK